MIRPTMPDGVVHGSLSWPQKQWCTAALARGTKFSKKFFFLANRFGGDPAELRRSFLAAWWVAVRHK